MRAIRRAIEDCLALSALDARGVQQVHRCIDNEGAVGR
jgi:hypothetical protein